MASYDEIKDYCYENYGFIPKSCWIADMKQKCGIPVRISPQRKTPDSPAYPCPQNRQKAIIEAFQHFKMLIDSDK